MLHPNWRLAVPEKHLRMLQRACIAEDVRKKDAPTTLEGQALGLSLLTSNNQRYSLASHIWQQQTEQVEALLVQKRQRQAIQARVREGARDGQPMTRQ